MSKSSIYLIINSVEEALLEERCAAATIEEQKANLELAKSRHAVRKEAVEQALIKGEEAGYSKRNLKQMADDRLQSMISGDLLQVTPLPLYDTQSEAAEPVAVVKTRQTRTRRNSSAENEVETAVVAASETSNTASSVENTENTQENIQTSSDPVSQLLSSEQQDLAQTTQIVEDSAELASEEVQDEPEEDAQDDSEDEQALETAEEDSVEQNVIAPAAPVSTAPNRPVASRPSAPAAPSFLRSRVPVPFVKG